MGFFVHAYQPIHILFLNTHNHMFKPNPIPYQTCTLANTTITVKRVDRVHTTISGNKFYKLKYNLMQAKQQGFNQILSFGGAYSNHIFAIAHACNAYGFDSIGIIRGQELASKPLNHTLQTAQSLGMQLDFISRSDYRNKHTSEFLAQLKAQYPNAYIIPEGGTNQLAVKGCSEILSKEDTQNFDVIVLAVGTGGTIAGIMNTCISDNSNQQVIGFSALNSDYQADDINKLISNNYNNWQLYKDDVFGGYGKYNDELLAFIESIKQQASIPLEPIYTGKAMYRLQQLLKQGEFESKRILFIHTGGLQAFEY